MGLCSNDAVDKPPSGIAKRIACCTPGVGIQSPLLCSKKRRLGTTLKIWFPGCLSLRCAHLKQTTGGLSRTGVSYSDLLALRRTGRGSCNRSTSEKSPSLSDTGLGICGYSDHMKNSYYKCFS